MLFTSGSEMVGASKGIECANTCARSRRSVEVVRHSESFECRVAESRKGSSEMVVRKIGTEKSVRYEIAWPDTDSDRSRRASAINSLILESTR